jgi:uncharacterized membrane protein YhfC
MGDVLRMLGWLVMAFGGPALALWARGRWGRPVAWLGVGALTFLGAQAVRLPLLAGLTALFRQGLLPPPWDPFMFDLVVLSLSAGLFEETARWWGMRWAQRRQARHGQILRSADAVVLGLAHGGTEAFVIGLVGWVTLMGMLLMREGLIPIPPGMEASVAAYWATPPSWVWVAVLERGMAILFHVGLALVIWDGVRRGRRAGWAAAVLLHGLVNGTASAAMARRGIEAAEGLIALWVGLFLGGIFIRLRKAGSIT